MRSFTAFRKTIRIILYGAWPEKSNTPARLFWPSAYVEFLVFRSERVLVLIFELDLSSNHVSCDEKFYRSYPFVGGLVRGVQ
jgi:hypothetical protein